MIPPALHRQLALRLSPEGPRSFSGYVTGLNGELVAQLRALATPAGVGVVYLWGAPDGGKSHLLEAFAEAARALPGGVRRWDGGPPPEDCAAATVDDVERLGAADQVVLFGLLNRAREGGLRLAVAGHAPPARLALRPDVTSRLAAGLVYEVRALTDADKPEALRRHARSLGFALGDEVIAYLLTHWRRDLASLVEVLRALDEYSIAARRPVTVTMARELLRGLDPL